MKQILFFLFILLFVGCSSSFYKPHGGPYGDYPEHIERVTFETDDGQELVGFFMKSSTKSKGVIVHFHGNTGNAQTYFVFVDWFTARGYDVFTFDYRGFGESTGEPSRHGLVRDSKAAIDYVAKQKKWDNIYLFGQSLGGNQAIAAVDDYNRHFIDGIIVDCTFYSYASVANNAIGDLSLTYPLAWLLVGGNAFSAANYIENLHVPILFLHGDKDEIVPISHGYRLFEEATFPKQFIAVVNCGHVETIRRDYVRSAIINFLESNSLELKYIQELEQPVASEPNESVVDELGETITDELRESIINEFGQSFMDEIEDTITGN